MVKTIEPLVEEISTVLKESEIGTQTKLKPQELIGNKLTDECYSLACFSCNPSPCYSCVECYSPL
ncbi:MAG TPA: hypothetical protein PKW70_03190 [Candidatus Pacearchaeota archaeon]|nr:hypothetical protein [Candidatus Pacearchaeota archaeon]